ncbi:MAG: GDSL-type esterase/lipase family protein [bacterium]|nr:GDSL-type esterase/lipase family protein [bacterium]
MTRPYLRVVVLICLPFLLAAAFIAASRAQEATPESTPQAQPLLPRATPQRPSVAIDTVLMEGTEIRLGPGHTYAPIQMFPNGTEITITARNRVGNWLEVRTTTASNTVVSGWVLTGYVVMEGIHLSAITVRDMPDADVAAVTNPNLARLYMVPVVPAIDEAMRAVFTRGQAAGNNAGVVVKVGDSNSANRYYLTPINTSPVDLGPYDFLLDTVLFFAPALPQEHVTARVGLNAYSLFDPSWGTAQCQSGETPLACEYRLHRPSVAIVMFGPNDIRALNSERWRDQMERLVEESLAAGVIPVLTTFSSLESDPDLAQQALRFNLILVEVANQYDVPLINLWSAARSLPNFGIGGDGVHMTVGGGRVNFTEGQEARFGVSLQNLLVLYTLDELRRVVIDQG